MADVKKYTDHWAKIRGLGKGGQAETVKASNKINEQPTAAIKILLRQTDDERRARMHREATNLKTISHPNILKVIEDNTEYWGDKQYELFVAMEFIPGETFAKFDFSKTNLAEKIELMINIAQTVSYCHQKGIIHRDIKPDNLILKNNSIKEPFVIDFGLSFNFEENDNDNLTPTGQHIGNRFLILPEQKVGETSKRDMRSDVTCLVGIFYFLITSDYPTVIINEHGQKPHQKQNSKIIIDKFPKHQKDIINNLFDTGFNQLIDKRWQTTESLILQLNSLKNAEPTIMNTEKDLINTIKNKTAHQDYQQAKSNQSLFNEIDNMAKKVVNQVIEELGSADWLPVGSGSTTTGESYKNGLSIWNAVDKNLKTNTIIHTFITGSELVIQLLEDNKSYEIFRQPLLGEIDFSQFKVNLRNHYISELAKK